MAFDLLRSAKHIRGLSNAEFRVLFYLLESAHHETHLCFPSMKRIADIVEMSERTVQRHISALAERGLFVREEQRRTDGSRMVNCYRFVASGTMKIGKESVVILEPERETEGEQQPAIIGGLDNPPILTPPPVRNDTTPRQDCRDIDQESEPGIRTSPLSPDGESPPSGEDLFGGDLPIAPAFSLSAFVWQEWEQLEINHPNVAMPRLIDEGLAKMIEQRARTHAKLGETPVEVWTAVFEQIRASLFLCGRTAPGPGRDKSFTLSLGWLCRPANFREVINGKYTSKSTDAAYGADGQRLGPTGQAVGGALARLRAAKERGAGGRDPRSAAGGGR